MSTENPLLTCRDAAKKLGVSTTTVRDWRENRGLPSIRLSKRILYPAKALDAWLERQQETATT